MLQPKELASLRNKRVRGRDDEIGNSFAHMPFESIYRTPVPLCKHNPIQTPPRSIFHYCSSFPFPFPSGKLVVLEVGGSLVKASQLMDLFMSIVGQEPRTRYRPQMQSVKSLASKRLVPAQRGPTLPAFEKSFPHPRYTQPLNCPVDW